MKQLILIGLLLGSMISGLHAEAPPRPPEAKESIKEEPKVSTGERIELSDVGLSIVPPSGWMVHKNSHGSSLLFEAPKQPNQIYQPTLQVMVFSKLRYIDEVTMKEYGDLIVEKFGKMSNRVTGYRLRDAAIQRLETGDPSILYYTEFQYDDVPIMQMHILISSASNHFVMTYTDLAKVFEDESSPGLAIAYTSMHSTQLDSRPPWRWRGFAIGGVAALVVISGWFILRFMRAHRIARLGQRIEEEDSKEITRDEESQYYSRHTPATQADSHLGDDDWASAKPHSKAAGKARRAQTSDFDDDDEPEVSDVVPISTLEKSLHPGRKRRQETAAPRNESPMMPQHPPVSNHPAAQQAYAPPSIPAQAPQFGNDPQYGNPNGQAIPHAQQPLQGLPPPAVHGQPLSHPGVQTAQQPMQGMNDQGMPQPGRQNGQHQMYAQSIPQLVVQNTQPLSHSGAQNVQQPVPPQGIQGQSMQQPGMPNSQHQVQAQGVPQQAAQNTQPLPHSGAQNVQQPVPLQGIQGQSAQQQEVLNSQLSMHNAQRIPQHSAQNTQPLSHPDDPNAQQPMPQQGMHGQSLSQPEALNVQHQVHSGQAIPQYAAQPPSHPGVQQARQGMPQTENARPHSPSTTPQHSVQTQAGMPEPPPGAYPHAGHPQNAPQAFPTSAAPGPMFATDSETVISAPQFVPNHVSSSEHLPRVHPHSQPPVSEQPAYVHQVHSKAAQAHAAPGAPSVALGQGLPPQAPATVMPQFAPSDDADEGEPPISSTRVTQSKMSNKQPLSQNSDDEPEITEEARLSEILPKAGTIEKSKPKRKGLFWRKKADDDDDQDEASDDKAGWNVPAEKKSKGKDDDEDGEGDGADEWAVAPSKKLEKTPIEKDDDEAQDATAWAPEATRRSEPRKDSLLNETEGPQRLARRSPEGPITKAQNNAAVTEDGWNLDQEAASDHGEEDEEEVS